MIGIMNRITKQELDFHQVMIYKDTMNYDPGEDVLAAFKPDQKILLSKLMLLIPFPQRQYSQPDVAGIGGRRVCASIS